MTDRLDPAFLARLIAACRDGQSPEGIKLVEEIASKASPVTTAVLKLRILSTQCHNAKHLAEDLKADILGKHYELLVIITEIETTLNILEGMSRYINEIPSEVSGPICGFAVALAKRSANLAEKADKLEAEATLLVTQYVTDLFPEVAAKMEQMK